MEVQSRRQPHETTHPTGSSSSELADMAAAQIAKLEDSLEREAGEKRELNSQVSHPICMPRSQAFLSHFFLCYSSVGRQERK